jgi:hypothetical protein
MKPYKGEVLTKSPIRKKSQPEAREGSKSKPKAGKERKSVET